MRNSTASDGPHGYVRLQEPSSPGSGSQSQQGFFFPSVLEQRLLDVSEDDTDTTVVLPHSRRSSRSHWWRPPNVRGRANKEESNYLTLIPLSDSRLKPPRTKLIVTTLLILATLAVATVFVIVPRGVTVGTIQVKSSQISFNTSQSTYTILLTASLPVYNPNYLPVLLSGTVNVSFYDQQAGYSVVRPVSVPARALPEVVRVNMDASSVPQKYLFTIYTQCFTFPEKLIFFLRGNLQVQFLGAYMSLPPIDNYFIISCTQSDDDGGGKSDDSGGASSTPAVNDINIQGRVGPGQLTGHSSDDVNLIADESSRRPTGQHPVEVASLAGHSQQQQPEVKAIVGMTSQGQRSAKSNMGPVLDTVLADSESGAAILNVDRVSISMDGATVIVPQERVQRHDHDRDP